MFGGKKTAALESQVDQLVVELRQAEVDLACAREDHERELAFIREEHDRQRADLLRDLRATIEQDLIRSLRLEHAHERAVFMKEREQFTALREAAKALLTETAHDPYAAQMPREQAEKRIREILKEAEEVLPV
jgi:hypothetical protein